MADVVVFKIQKIDNGYVAYGPDNAVYRERLLDAKNNMVVFVDAWVKDFEKRERDTQQTK
jgi:hypothetical protein